MLSGLAIARRVRAPALVLSRILCRKKQRNAPRPGILCPYSTYEVASPPAMFKEAKEPVYTPTLVYKVRRCDPELVGPASQTPRDTKRLSDLDDMQSARIHLSLAFFYRGGKDDGGVDPAGVIRRALGEALVHYYPLAGRLREMEGERLVVDCTGEGVLFVQADADVKLVELEAAGLKPPFPCWDQLLFDVEGSSGMLDCPLLHIQVTRLSCGGFVFALRFNHTICDGFGIAQFLNAVSELARGLPSITVRPVWSREIIEASPMAPFVHRDRECEVFPPPPAGDIVKRSFTFSTTDVAAIKKSLRVVTATTFEALAAFLWRARTMALEVLPGEDATLAIAANFRGVAGINLPAGYYGNACLASMVLVNAAALRHGSLGDAVELVRLAKAAVTAHYFRSMLDALVGRQWVPPANWFFITDARRLGFNRVDLGWGEPVYAGPVDPMFGASFFVAVKDRDGEEAVVVPVALPRLAMDRFAAEVERLLLLLNRVTT